MRLIAVEPILKEYVPYDIATLGLATGSLYKDKLYNTWRNMMRSCYAIDYKDYPSYGAKGVCVCKSWHVLENFIEDTTLLHGWKEKQTSWGTIVLTKEYYSSNIFSPETCIWIPRNIIHAYTYPCIQVEAPDGCITLYLSKVEAHKELGMSLASLKQATSKATQISRGAFKGYTFKKYTSTIPMRDVLT